MLALKNIISPYHLWTKYWRESLGMSFITFLMVTPSTIKLEDKEKTTFTCPFGTFAFRKMPFGLCNA